MTIESRRVAGLSLILVPAVVVGGVSVLTLLVHDPAYMDNPLRQDLWRAGHAHAGVLLVLSLVALRYVDEAKLTERTRATVRWAFPVAAVLMPLAFFLSVLDPGATQPNALINLAYLGGAVLIAATVTLGVGLLRATTPAQERSAAR